MTPADLIKYDNLLDEAKWAAHGQDLCKAQDLLDQAQLLIFNVQTKETVAA